jgi:hypothetical protein
VRETDAVPDTGDVLAAFQDWFVATCDGEWEHDAGVSIGSLDNLGSRVRVSLRDTANAGRGFERQETHRDEYDWIVYWVENDEFNAACGPRNLGEALSVFLDWAH